MVTQNDSLEAGREGEADDSPNAGLTAPQERAIIALLNEPTIVKAAQQAEVGDGRVVHMTLTRRIVNLEAVHVHTLHACRTCGGYNPMNPAYAITRHDRPLEHCTECGLALDDNGRPLPEHYKRVILSHDAPEGVP